MTNKIRALGVLLLAVSGCCILGCSRSGESAAYDNLWPAWRLKWRTGDVFQQSVSVEQKMEMNVPGVVLPMRMNTDILFEHRLTVLRDLPDDGRELDLEYVSQRIESQSGGRVVSHYDSNEDPSMVKGLAGAATMRKMIGKHLDFQVNGAGRMLSVSNLTEFISQVGGSRSNVLGSWFTEESVKEYCELGQDLPHYPVNPGEQWSVKTVNPIGSYGTIEIQSEFTFKGLEQRDGLKCARLEYTGVIMPVPLKWVSSMFIGFDKGKVSGVEWFDVEHGMLVEKYFDQDLNGKMIIKGEEIPVVFKQTGDIRMKRLSVLDRLTHPARWVRCLVVFLTGGPAWLPFVDKALNRS